MSAGVDDNDRLLQSWTSVDMYVCAMFTACHNMGDVVCVLYVRTYLFNVSSRYSMADMSVLSYPYPPDNN